MPDLPKPENEWDKYETGLLVYDELNMDLQTLIKFIKIVRLAMRIPDRHMNVPNLLDLVPAVVLGLTEQEVTDMRKK